MHGRGDEDGEEIGRRKETLLSKLGLPIEHVDYGYVRKCADGKELERILRVLRSGEEGFYPDLEAFVLARLQEVNPQSRLLRAQVPILRPEGLETKEREGLEKDLLSWIQGIEEDLIFGDSGQDPQASIPPIRGAGVISKDDKVLPQAPVKKLNADRIKSCEYDKWDKWDVDTELMKLDIDEMRKEEAEKVGRKSVGEERQDSRIGIESQESSRIPGQGSDEVHDLGESFIEEVPEPEPLQETKPKRRVKIVIEDVHLG